VTCACFWWNQY